MEYKDIVYKVIQQLETQLAVISHIGFTESYERTKEYYETKERSIYRLIEEMLEKIDKEEMK